MPNYYSEKLSANKLQICYDVASPRIRQYLAAELDHVVTKVQPTDLVLDLGCGYGRTLPSLCKSARFVVGIDLSYDSLVLGKELLRNVPNCLLMQMDAAHLAFLDGTFDIVLCIQNGISAFHTDQRRLIEETIRITKHGGMVLFSTYSEKFWKHRLEWFERQAEAGVVGEIDYDKTRNGNIVCKDGFTATTVSAERFIELTAGLPVATTIVEVDQSSLFCEMVVQ